VGTDAKVYAMVDDLPRSALLSIADDADIPNGAFSIGSPMLRQWIKAQYEAGKIKAEIIVYHWAALS
jgi:hypothetical protein